MSAYALPHVLHVVRTLGRTGGMERNLYRVVVALKKRGIRHSIALLSDFPETIDFGDHAPVYRVVTPTRDPRMAVKLRALIRMLRPTVVHARNWAALSDVAMARMSLASRPPLIFSYHGSEAVEHGISLRDRLKCQLMARITSRLFAVSNASRELLIDTYGIKHQPISVIPNGVDTERFSLSHEPRSTPNRLKLGTVGRLYKIKNIPLLIRAAAQAVRLGADVEVEVAGDGDIPELTELARDEGIGDRTRFVGRVDDVPGFLRGLDAFVLPSDNEGHPNALLEAMSCGLPCVATKVGGSTEVLSDGSGLLVPRRDRNPMVSAIMRLAKDVELRGRLGKAARVRVESRYSQSRMFGDYEALYRAPLADEILRAA